MAHTSRLEREGNTTLAKNVLMLMLAQAATKVMGLIYRIVIINIDGFGNEGNGYYSVGFDVYTVLLTLSSIGVPNVIAKLISERMAAGDAKGSQRMLKVCFCLFLSISFVSACFLYLGADFIAARIMHVPDVALTLRALSPAVFFASAIAVFRGYFSGMGSQKATSISQVVEQFANCVLSILFVCLCIGQGPARMAAAGNLSTSASVLVAFVFLIFFYQRRRREIRDACRVQTVPAEDRSAKQLLGVILALSIPMAAGSLISAFNSFIDSFTITNYIQDSYGAGYAKEWLEARAAEAAGTLGKVNTIINMPLAINTAFSTALVPAVAAAVARGERQTAANKLSFSLFTSLVIILPCAVGLAVLSGPILQLLFPIAPDRADLLALSVIPLILLALTTIANGALYGLGQVKVPAAALALGAAVKFGLNYLLIRNPEIRITGAVISSIVCDAAVFAIVFTCLGRRLSLKFGWFARLVKPLICSAVMGLCAWLTYLGVSRLAGNAVATAAAILAGAAVYLIAVAALRVFKEEELLTLPKGATLLRIMQKIGFYKKEET